MRKMKAEFVVDYVRSVVCGLSFVLQTNDLGCDSTKKKAVVTMKRKSRQKFNLATEAGISMQWNPVLTKLPSWKEAPVLQSFSTAFQRDLGRLLGQGFGASSRLTSQASLNSGPI